MCLWEGSHSIPCHRVGSQQPQLKTPLSSIWMLRTTCPPASSMLADSLPTPEIWEHTGSSCLQVTCQLCAEQSQQRAAGLDQIRKITQLISKIELNKGCCFMSSNFGYMLLLAIQEFWLREKLYQQRRLQLIGLRREGGTDGLSHVRWLKERISLLASCYDETVD